MTVKDLIKTIEAVPYHNERIITYKIVDAREPQYGEPDSALSPAIKSYLNGKRLFLHQCRTIDSVSRSLNVIIVTPTASGKSLAFNIPVFDRLEGNKNDTALYLYPTKALSNDQLKSIKEMEAGTKIKTSAAIYDGDTESGKRGRIRDNSRIVISNPHELHHLLQWHYKWRRFLSNLRFVVIDEAHTYRGVYGSNVSLLLRRFRRICEYYGSAPQFILSSATIANPIELAEKLTGLEFALVDQNGSPSGQKALVFYNPYFNDTESSTYHDTTKLIAELTRCGMHGICFTVSRKMAELLAVWSRAELPDDLAKKIITYRAGYLPKERREIENSLKAGNINVVVSTNALELGIDVGALDSAIICGYPGTVTSLWQQAGRAGRGRDESVVFFVAFLNPLDQFFMNHPGMLFRSPYENAIIDPSNQYLVSGHLLCAASEMPLNVEDDSKYFGDAIKEYIDAFESEKLLTKTESGYVYSGTVNPVEKVGLESFSSETFTVMYNGMLLETMDRNQVFRDAHTGAVLMHQGETYLVKELDLNSAIATVEKRVLDYYTVSLKTVMVQPDKPFKTKTYGSFQVSLARLNVEERHTGYNVKRYDSIIKKVPLDLPPIEFSTVGFTFTIPYQIRQQVSDQRMDFAGGLHGVEHAMIGILPLQVMCDRWDLGGVSIPGIGRGASSEITIYDGYAGGIGLSEKAFDLFEDLLEITYELVNDCKCDNGCPACVYSPKCGNDNKPLDKEAAKLILKLLLQEIQSPRNDP